MPVVAVLDIGSAAKTGWWRSEPGGSSTEGRDVDGLCDALLADLTNGSKVALGFEAPLWLPLATNASQLGKARPGEPMSWSGGAGATVLTYGIQQMTYVLHRLAAASTTPPTVTFDPEQLRRGVVRMLVGRRLSPAAPRTVPRRSRM